MLTWWSAPTQAAATSCRGDATGITLPDGFCATIFADNLGHARQMAFSPDGTLYVNTWSGVYYNNGPVPAGGFIVALKDKSGSGHADVIERFGETVASGGHGGTGIAFHNGMIYAEINDRIVRYPFSPNDIAPKGKGETIVSGLPTTGDHPMHPFLITPQGDLFVDLGSATNDCEKKNRFPHSPGNEPCTEKLTRAGVWRYDANKTDQHFSPAGRYASGLRNGEGFSLDAAGHVFVTQHGRDQLREDWPELYSARQGQDLPAEELVELRQGADYGWPECYFDNTQRKLVLGPEYGGDGGKKIGVCAERQGPVAFFPAHRAPNDVKIYLGKTFPKAYQGWAPSSRSTAPGTELRGRKEAITSCSSHWPMPRQTGPMSSSPTGLRAPRKIPAVQRSGLRASLSLQMARSLFRMTCMEEFGASPIRAAIPKPRSRQRLPPWASYLRPHRQRLGRRKASIPTPGKDIGALPVPKGFTKEQLALGSRVFHGEVADGTCGGCHGANGKGSPVAPDLTTGKWLWSDGSLQGLEDDNQEWRS